MPTLMRAAYRIAIRSLYVGFAFCFLTGCAEVQMGYNVLSYDNAVADTANQLLLLNAVRASQHYPRSFTSVGDLAAGPPLSGNLASTLNFSALVGLQTYGLNPSASASAGYNQFGLGNLNAKKFMVAIRAPISKEITGSFRQSTGWPRQLLDLIYFQNFNPTEQIVRSVDSARKSKCRAPVTRPGTESRCERMNEQIDEFTSRCNAHFIDVNVRIRDFRDDDRGIYYNTAVNYCHYSRFRIFLEEVRLVFYPICTEKPGPGCLPAKERSALEMIGYLGELIAAQNYIEEPFIPHVLYGRSVGPGYTLIDVPLFVVRRAEPLGSAAVAVQHDGATYYIPRPEFGSPTEERSLQTLELVLQTVQAATQPEDLPKTVPPVAVLKQ
jgi:hypothetical protein